jgi:alpha-beta hydrolase superfamily lysophospholipase
MLIKPVYANIAAILTMLLLLLLPGCAHQQYATTPYPAWGEENSIPQPDDHPPLLLRIMYPADSVKPEACLLLVHGMNEHIGRYHDVARYFVQQNFIVAGFDYEAHGLSNPVLWQADQALRAGAGTVDVSEAYLAQAALGNLDPARASLDLALQKTIALCDTHGAADYPVFILSHSLGGLITATFLLQNRNAVTERVLGVVFLGPGFAVSEPPGWLGWLANPIIKLSFHAETHFLNPHDEPFPLMAFNQVLAFLTVPVLEGVFEILSLPGLRRAFSTVTPAWVVDYLTDSAEEKKKIRDDSWIIRRTVPRYAKGIEEEIVLFRRQMHAFDTPYDLIYSAQDPITPAWGNEDFIHATLNNHSDNRYLELTDSRYHQHLFLTEPRRSEVLQHITQWLMHRIKVLNAVQDNGH